MNYARLEFTSDGSTSEFTIPFPYVDESEVRLAVNDAPYEGVITFISPSLVSLSPVPAAGSLCILFRQTDVDTPRVVFHGGPIASSDLNKASDQHRARLQELGASVEDALQGGLSTERAQSAAAEAQIAADVASTLVAASLSSAQDLGHRAAWTAAHIPLVYNSIRVTGFAANGDGGAGLYKRVSIQPTHVAKFQSADGAWWELAERNLAPEMFAVAGTPDVSSALIAFSASANITLGAGAYQFNSGNNPTIEHMALDDHAQVNGEHFANIMPKDGLSGRLVGLAHNHRELKLNPSGVTPQITNGVLNWPPTADAIPQFDVEVGCHFYNNWGLEAVRIGNGANGWPGWYTWEWNHTDAVAYDPSRRSLLGHFRGDDPKVLDWHMYWLLSHGVTCCSLNPAAQADLSTWATPSNLYHWLYQLFTNTPNFRKMRYMLSAACDFGLSAAAVTAAWNRTVDIMLAHPWFKTIDHNGGVYPCIYVFEGEAIRGSFDSFVGATATTAFYLSIAARFKAAGYAGVCLLVRNPTGEGGSVGFSYSTLEAGGVIYLPAEYSNVTGATDTTSIDTLTATMGAPAKRAVFNIVTSRLSQSPITAFTTSGHSPAKFEAMLRKAVNIVRANREFLPQLVLVYACGEWAEGGPGLHPNAQDGFGYLEAVANAVVSERPQAPLPSPTDPYAQFVKATNIVPSSLEVAIYSDFDVRMNGNPWLPTIGPSRPGAEVVVTPRQVLNPTLRYKYVLFDDSLVAGTKLKLAGGDQVLTLFPYDRARFRCQEDGATWVLIEHLKGGQPKSGKLTLFGTTFSQNVTFASPMAVPYNVCLTPRGASLVWASNETSAGFTINRDTDTGDHEVYWRVEPANHD